MLLKFINNFRYSIMSMFISVPLLMFAIEWIYYESNHFNFSFTEKLSKYGVYILFAVICSVAVSVLLHKSIEESPLFLADAIIKEAKTEIQYMQIFNDHHGVYTLTNVKLEPGKVLNVYRLISDEVLLIKLKTHLKILHHIKDSDSKDTQTKINKIINEIEYSFTTKLPEELII